MIIHTYQAERALVCSACQEFLPLFPENRESVKLEEEFRAKHWEHAVMTVNIDEVDNTLYKLFKGWRVSE